MEETKTQKHKPTLRKDDLVVFDSGPHAGMVGEVLWLSLVTKRLIVQTQTGEAIPGTIYEVSKVV